MFGGGGVSLAYLRAAVSKREIRQHGGINCYSRRLLLYYYRRCWRDVGNAGDRFGGMLCIVRCLLEYLRRQGKTSGHKEIVRSLICRG